jgi:hypothetical protein
MSVSGNRTSRRQDFRMFNKNVTAQEDPANQDAVPFDSFLVRKHKEEEEEDEFTVSFRDSFGDIARFLNLLQSSEQLSKKGANDLRKVFFDLWNEYQIRARDMRGSPEENRDKEALDKKAEKLHKYLKASFSSPEKAQVENFYLNHYGPKLLHLIIILMAFFMSSYLTSYLFSVPDHWVDLTKNIIDHINTHFLNLNPITAMTASNLDRGILSVIPFYYLLDRIIALINAICDPCKKDTKIMQPVTPSTGGARPDPDIALLPKQPESKTCYRYSVINTLFGGHGLYQTLKRLSSDKFRVFETIKEAKKTR